MIGMPPATAASKATITPLLLRGGEDLVAVQRDQGLVGGDHVLALLDRAQHQLRAGSVPPISSTTICTPGSSPRQNGSVGQAHAIQSHSRARSDHGPRRWRPPDAAPGAPRDLVAVARQHVDGAAPTVPRPSSRPTLTRVSFYSDLLEV
jgi:hypothetical protein